MMTKLNARILTYKGITIFSLAPNPKVDYGLGWLRGGLLAFECVLEEVIEGVGEFLGM